MPAVLKGDSMKKSLMALTLCALMSGSIIFAADQTPRDNFYWLGQINKASDIINTDEGLLTPAEGKNIAHGIQKVLDEGNKRAARVRRMSSLSNHTSSRQQARKSRRSMPAVLPRIC